MKKFMILLLSLAVLFSFAACDNSSDTPTTEPGDEGSVSYAVTKQIGKDVADFIGGFFTKGFGASQNFVTSGTVQVAAAPDWLAGAIAKYELEDANTYTSVSYVVTVEGTTDIEDQAYTLTIYGKDAKNYTSAETTREVNLSSYQLDFSYPDLQGSNPTYERIEGSVTGFVTGSMDVTIDNTGKVTALAMDSTAPSVYLPEVTAKAEGVSYGTLSVDAADLLANINEGAGASSSPYSYDAKRKENISTIEGDIKGFVTVLTGANSTDKLASLVADLTAQGAVAKGVYDSTGNGKATITFTAGNDAVKLASDSSSKYVFLPANGTMVLELTGATSGSAASGSFAVAGYTFVSGTLRVCDTDDINDVHDAFSSITLNGVSGKATGTVKSNGATVVNGVDTLVFTDTTAGTVTASAIVAPEYGATAETVTADYAN